MLSIPQKIKKLTFREQTYIIYIQMFPKKAELIDIILTNHYLVSKGKGILVVPYKIKLMRG